METYREPVRLRYDDFVTEVDGQQVALYTLRNGEGIEVNITNYGAKIVSLCVPDRNEKPTDIVLGHDSISDYLSSSEPYFGAVCGRVANRIANGRFELDGIEYELATNNGPNALHGGIKGFNSVVWTVERYTNQQIELSYLSKDGEEGYPGNLKVTVVYEIRPNNALSIVYRATTDAATIINLTNHSYFNLSGEGDESICDHLLTVNAEHYLPTDETSIPLGAPQPVALTPMDFRTPHVIGERIDDDFEALKIGRGYDHNYLLNNSSNAIDQCVVRCISPKNGIELKVYTTEPGLQIYTGNWMTGKLRGKGGHSYPSRSAVCFETQHYPDSINHPDYPSVVLRPGEEFMSETIFQFGIAGK